jgi:hypothetical protein
MLIVCGSRLYGKVDVVPDFFHVQTRFGHLSFIPLLPLRSFLIVDRERDAERAVPIPLSLKSVIVGWLQGSAVAAMAVGLFGAAVLTLDRVHRYRGDYLPWVGLAIGGSVLMVLLMKTPFIKRARYSRAAALAEFAELSEPERIQLDLRYGAIDQAEAQRRLKALAAREAADARAAQAKRAPLEF